MKKSTFKKGYLIYLLVLAVLVFAAAFYVNRLLHQYEASLPEQVVKSAGEELQNCAVQGTFWEKYSLPEVTPGVYEEHLDVKKEYLKQLSTGEFTYVKTNEADTEEELVYRIEKDGTVLAKVTLQAAGPARTRLAVLSFREWQVSSIEPVLAKNDYTLSVPADFTVKVNGIAPDADAVEQKGDESSYTIAGTYLVPEFAITDKAGNAVNYTVEQHKVKAEFYYYTLLLPASIRVEVNGEAVQGTEAEKYRVRYEIRELVKPEVLLSDYYGNEVSYEGGDKMPLTYLTLIADEQCNVTVAGSAVAEEAISVSDNPEYAALSDFLPKLPQVKTYDIAMLKEDAQIVVTDERGQEILMEEGAVLQDLTARKRGFEEVPQNVAGEVDVLAIAKKWSLFMTNDASFQELKPYLIADSYQYQVVSQYATGVDRTFTSAHSLANPAFTDELVTNYTQIADNCFSVDISFIKHMVLSYGTKVDDPMNDRFYFIKYDDTEDGIDNPTWKIASMKEIVNND